MNDASFLEAVFSTALEKRSAAERADYLDAACASNGEVRRQVERLLRANSKMGNFLGRPAVEQLAGTLTLADSTRSLEASMDSEDNALAFLQPAMRPDSLGRIGHYEVLDVLGRGGFGIVLCAMDETLLRMVAVKVLVPQLAASFVARKRFIAEARSSARIRHANVVQVYAVEDQPLPYLVMELIPGESLQQRLVRTGHLDAIEVARIGRQVAEGLAAAHKIGLIHRDVKPENILLESTSEYPPGEAHVRISDFGLARAADDVSLTQYGIVAGTPMFMAPEQALGEPLDHRADLFSLGSVLYTMCCGQAPFRGKSTFAVLRRVVEDRPQPIREIAPETPQWLCEIIDRLHAKSAEDRFASAREVADLLGRHLAERPPSGNTPAISDARAAAAESVPVTLRVRRRPGISASRRWVVAAALILLLLGGLGFTEATGVTSFHGTVIRLLSKGGTLVVEVDDPGISIQIDGPELVITGAGVMEIRLDPGRHIVEARKDGKLVSRELVSVTNNGRQVVRVSQESLPQDTMAAQRSTDAVAWERSVSAMPSGEQAKAVMARLNELNPGLDGRYPDKDAHFDLTIKGRDLRDISPIRMMPGLTSLFVRSDALTDLEPLQGLALARLALACPRASSLSPLQGLKLTELDLSGSAGITDLLPLKGMSLERLTIAYTQVGDLTPLAEMKLELLNCDSTNVSDLSPLKGMPLASLGIHNTRVSDLTSLKDMPLSYLNCHNTPVSDAGLAPLKDCRNLAHVSLTATRVTAAGIDELSTALPTCKIEWDGGVIEPR